MKRKTARINRDNGESITIDETRVTVRKVKGKTWLEVDYPDDVEVSRVEKEPNQEKEECLP